MNAYTFSINSSQLNVTSFPTITNLSPTAQPTSSNNYSELTDGVRYTFATLKVCILILAVFGNAVLILLVCFHRKLCTTTNILIANLAAGDILLAIVVIPFDIDKLLRGHFAFSAGVCEMSSTAFFLSLPASAINLLIMTFERFCAVRFPLQHRTSSMFTRRRIVTILLCSWAYITTVALMPVMGWRSYPTQVLYGECLFYFEVEFAIFLLVANFVLPLILIIAMNLCILRIAKLSQIQRNETRNNTRALLTRSVSLGSSNVNNSTKNKTTRIIAILVGVFALCWLPYIINTTVNISCKGCSPQEVGLATMSLVYMNSAINPILYGIYKPQIRKTLKDVLTRSGRLLQQKKSFRNQTPDKDVEETCF